MNKEANFRPRMGRSKAKFVTLFVGNIMMNFMVTFVDKLSLKESQFSAGFEAEFAAEFAAEIVPDFMKFMTNLEDKLKLDFWQDLRPISAE